MATVEALIELEVEVDEALSTFAAASSSLDEGRRQVEGLLPDISGIAYRPTAKPVPMFTPPETGASWQLDALADFGSPETNQDMPSTTQVIPVQIEVEAMQELQARPGVRVWPSSPIAFFVDCPPFQPAVDVDTIRKRLDVAAIWDTGARGGGVVVGILDQGIDGDEYPVTGGFARPGAQQPGKGAITSHGSMCAADVLVAAPDARIHDYPFMVERSGGALVMLNAALEQRRVDGTPHILSNSWGFYAVPAQQLDPGQEIWDLDHPVHRKVREIVTSGATVFFAAGNCGQPCPAGKCQPSSIGAGKSIHASNSLAEVITVAAVNSAGDRIGYSSQGPGMFEHEKPDIAAYSHFFGNFGPGRPGGLAEPFDNGTSAACPVAAGVGALLLSAHPGLTPGRLRTALVDGVRGGGGWNADLGHGIIDAGASFVRLQGGP